MLVVARGNGVGEGLETLEEFARGGRWLSRSEWGATGDCGAGVKSRVEEKGRGRLRSGGGRMKVWSGRAGCGGSVLRAHSCANMPQFTKHVKKRFSLFEHA